MKNRKQKILKKISLQLICYAVIFDSVHLVAMESEEDPNQEKGKVVTVNPSSGKYDTLTFAEFIEQSPDPGKGKVKDRTKQLVRKLSTTQKSFSNPLEKPTDPIVKIKNLKITSPSYLSPEELKNNSPSSENWEKYERNCSCSVGPEELKRNSSSLESPKNSPTSVSPEELKRSSSSSVDSQKSSPTSVSPEELQRNSSSPLRTKEEKRTSSPSIKSGKSSKHNSFSLNSEKFRRRGSSANIKYLKTKNLENNQQFPLKNLVSHPFLGGARDWLSSRGWSGYQG